MERLGSAKWLDIFWEFPRVEKGWETLMQEHDEEILRHTNNSEF